MSIFEYKFNFLYSIGAFIRSVSYRNEIEKNFWKYIYLDYASILPFLPENAHIIADIGAGVGGIDVLLNQKYQDAHFYLIDKDENTPTTNGFSLHHGFYTSLTSIREIWGEIPERVRFVSPDTEIPTPDLVISLLSCGFHYPLATYETLFKKVIKNGGSVIVDLRNGTGELSYAEKLGSVQIISNDSKKMRIKLYE